MPVRLTASPTEVYSLWPKGLASGSPSTARQHSSGSRRDRSSKDRNHLAVMSSGSVDLSSGSGAWDFTDSDAKAYGTDGMKPLGDGNFGMFASDGSIDGFITAPDFNLWNTATTAGASGHELSDFNLDGVVTAPDFDLWNANPSAGASSAVPD